MPTPAPSPTPGARPRSRAATYRVQLHAGFTFDDAAAVAGYLAALGVSHLYCSPYLQAAAGSTHGYDVVDHGRLNGELGGADGHRRLVDQLARAGLGQVLDIVPNHMALAGRANAWWWDVLENGPSSVYASYFDIDWDPPQRKLAATVLMPVLGDQYGRVLEAGELVIQRQAGSFAVRYHDHEAPLSPRTLGGLLIKAAVRAGSEELESLAVAFSRLPPGHRTDRTAVVERHRDKEVLRTRLADLFQARPEVSKAIDAEIEALNRDPDALDDLLSQQNYRLAYWRTGAEELSYRRFFDIETLAGLRVEDEAVFADTHRLILGLVAEAAVDGLRVDHVDGLADPEGYLVRLRDATGGAYVVVEKILQADEELPRSWPVAGTTGYDFLNHASRLFVDSRHEAAMRACYAGFTGQHADYLDVVYAAKLQIMREELAAEVERLTGLLADVCERHRRQRDHTRRELRDALRELIAAFPVYRTYVRAGHPAAGHPAAGHPVTGHPVTGADRAHVAAAVAAAWQRRPDLDSELIGFIGELLIGGHPGRLEADFAVRFAQVSAPVMAKGVEDTAFYRYQPLVSLNEVGGDPGRFGGPVADFHQAMAGAARRWPEAMLTLSTHDTKRSGDVRARISVLSELPGEWERAVHRWAALNQGYKRDGWPDRNAEYLLYQTLVGSWPIEVGRVSAFMLKAAKEAKVHTSWIDPDADYDEALSAFVTAVVADQGFVADLEGFLAEQRLVERGRANSLGQTALLLTCPGIPDLYQGTELWDLSLVDPDNRRPVDYQRRRSLLDSLTGALPEQALARGDEGGPKLWLIHRVLLHRRRHPEAYGRSSGYEPLRVHGHWARHAVAFARSGGLAVIIPRLLAGPDQAWPGTTVELPRGAWTDVLTGERVDGGSVGVASLLRRFPVAVLGRE
jgi:(1->4)-alpha-D-glucan 1-alpha-D-glucosylmutase